MKNKVWRATGIAVASVGILALSSLGAASTRGDRDNSSATVTVGQGGSYDDGGVVALLHKSDDAQAGNE